MESNGRGGGAVSGDGCWADLEPGLALLAFRGLYPDGTSSTTSLPSNPDAASARLVCRSWMLRVGEAARALQPRARLHSPWWTHAAAWEKHFLKLEVLRVSVHRGGLCKSLVEQCMSITSLKSLSLDMYQHYAVARSIADDISQGLRAASEVLVGLSLRRCYINDSHLPALACLGRLRSLDLQGNHHLQLDGEGVTGEGLRHLSGLTNLTHLDISNNRTVDDAGLGHLSGLTNLTSLTMSDCTSVTGAGLEALPPLPILRVLDLNNNSQISDEAIASLGRHTALTSLCLMGIPCHAEAWRVALGPLKNVTALHTLAHNADSLPTTVQELPNLAELEISVHAMGEDSLFPALTQLTGLRRLKLHGTGLSTNLRELGALTSLRELQFRPGDASDLASSLPPGLTSLRLENCSPHVTAQRPAASLALLTDLTKLVLSQVPCMGVSDAWASVLSAVSTGLEHLAIINSYMSHTPGPPGLSASGLAALQALSQLRHLQIENQRVTANEVLFAVSTLTTLERLNLSGCRSLNRKPPAGVLCLTRLQNLVLEDGRWGEEFLETVLPACLTALTSLSYNVMATFPGDRRSLDLGVYDDADNVLFVEYVDFDQELAEMEG